MADFSHLKAFEVDNTKIADFSLTGLEIGGLVPKLQVVPSGESNPPYFNALLKHGVKYAKQVQSGRVSTAILAENRDTDRGLFATYVIRGWTDVVDSTGQMVPFTRANVLDFLSAIPNWAFDELRAFCTNPLNFVEEGSSPDATDVEEYAGN